MPPRELFDAVHAAGGFTQVNHPTIFPSSTPGFANLCRGCPWDYSDAETDWKRVDAFEVNTGPAAFGTTPNPFTATAIGEWDALRKRGFPLTGVAVSDSHHAGEVESSTQAPIGNGRTVVYADELSEDGVRRAIQAGHAYVKNFADAPELRLTATDSGRTAIMGDNLPGKSANFTVNVKGGSGMRLIELQDGEEINREEIDSKNFTHRFLAFDSPGEYRVQVVKDDVVQSVSNPITIGKKPRAIPAGVRAGGKTAALKLRVVSVKRRGTSATVVLQARSNGGAVLGGVRVGSGRAGDVTDSRGRATLKLKGLEPGRFRATATGAKWRSARATFRVR